MTIFSVVLVAFALWCLPGLFMFGLIAETKEHWKITEIMKIILIGLPMFALAYMITKQQVQLKFATLNHYTS